MTAGQLEAVARRLLRFRQPCPPTRSRNLSGEAITELRARGWAWDGEVLKSPSGKKIEHPTESELLRLRSGEGVGAVLAERKNGRVREAGV